MNPSQSAVILFDGVCNLCNSSVNYVIEHDPQGYFKLGALQSRGGQRLLRDHEFEPDYLGSLVLLENGEAYSGSTGALRIARRLDSPVKWLWWLIVLPTPLRDAVYGLVARNRYRWFGTRDQCRIPDRDTLRRFIADSEALNPAAEAVRSNDE